MESFKNKIQFNYTRERRAQRNTNFTKYTPKPIKNKEYNRGQIIPMNTQMNRNWNRRTEYNETPRSTQNHRYHSTERGRFTMNREINRHQYKNYRTNYENYENITNFNTPYPIRNENFQQRNPTPKIRQKEEEQKTQ